MRSTSHMVSIGNITAVVLVILFSVLGGRTALASPDYQQGGQIGYGDTVTGAISDSDPAQVWQFQGAAGDRVTILMEATSGDLDPYLGLMDWDGSVLAEDDDSGGGFNAMITYALPQSGIYFIYAARYGLDRGVSSGTYRLTLTAEAGYGGAGAEQQGQTPMQGGGSLEIVLTWQGTDDLDLEVEEPDGTRIYWDTPTSPSGGQLNSSQGNDYCQNVTSSPTETITWPAGAAPIGTYTIYAVNSIDCDNIQSPVQFRIVVLVDGSVVAEYTDTVSLQESYQTTFDFQGGVTAGPVTGQATGGGFLVFELAWQGLDDLDLVVVEPDGTRIYWDTPTSPSGGILDATSGNDYCENIAPSPTETISWPNGGAQAGDYLVHVRLSIDCDQVDEPIQFILTVSDENGVLTTFSGVLSGDQDVFEDVFSYSPSPGVAPASGVPDCGPHPQANFQYDVLGDDIQNTGTISETEGGVHFGVCLGEGDTVNVTMQTTSGNLVPYVALIGFKPPDSYSLLDEATGNPMTPATLSFTAPDTGWYFIGLSHDSFDGGPTTGDFMFSITFQRSVPVGPIIPPGPGGGQPGGGPPPAGVPIQGGDSRQTAIPINYGETITASITDTQYMVFFQFNAAAGDHVTITMTGISGDLDPYLGLMDQAGNVIVEDDDSAGGFNAQIATTLPSSGTYYIVATRFGLGSGTSAGDFMLQITNP